MSIVSFIYKAAPATSLAIGMAGAAVLYSAVPALAARSGSVAVSAQAAPGKSFRTDASTWQDVVLPDGSTLTLAPGSAATISAFSLNQVTGERRLSIALRAGRIRVTSGFRAAPQPILITTPSGTVQLRNGAAMVRVEGDGAVATLLFGSGLSLSSGGASQTITRAGFSGRLGRGQAERLERLSSDAIAAEAAALTPPPGVRLATRSAAPQAAVRSPSAGAERMAASEPRTQQARVQRTAIVRRTAARRPECRPELTREERQRLNCPLLDTQGQEQRQQALFANRDVQDQANVTPTPLDPPPTDTTPPPAPASVVLNLGEGLGAAGLTSDAPTSRATAANQDEKALVLRELFSSRVRAIAEDGVTRPQIGYRDIRGQLTIPVPQPEDFTLRQYLFGGTAGFFTGLAPFRENSSANAGGGAGQALFDIRLAPSAQEAGSRRSTYSVLSVGAAEKAGLFFRTYRVPVVDETPNKPSALREITFAATSGTSPYDPDKSLWVAVGGIGSFRLIARENANGELVTQDGFGPLNPIGLPLSMCSECLRLRYDPATPSFTFFDVTSKSGQRLLSFGGPDVTAPLPNSTLLPESVAGFAVSKYRISDGLQGFEAGKLLEEQGDVIGFNKNDAFRRDGTFIDGARGDTELLVASNSGSNNVVLRGDLQIGADGRSNVSVTVGEIVPADVQPPGGGKLVMNAQVIGSTRLDTKDTSIHISGPVGSLGTGDKPADAHFFTGNTALKASAAEDPARSTQRIGYFAVGPNTSITERAVKGTPDSYIFTRLAIGQSYTTGSDPSVGTRDLGSATPGTSEYGGFVAAIGESKKAGSASIDLTSLVGTLREFKANPLTNLLSADIRLESRGLASGQVDGSIPDIKLGGSSGTSAYVTNNTYGARTATTDPRAEVGMIVAPEALKKGMYVDPQVITKLDRVTKQPIYADAFEGGAPKTYQHVQWGYFFGDVLKSTDGARTDHVNLGHMVAGKPTDPSSIRLSGTARYSGHISATIATPSGGLKDHIGAFEAKWNFDARGGGGTVNADLASRSYQGSLNALSQQQRNLFSGTLNHTGGLSTMKMNGGFFGPVPLVGTLGTPPAMGGTVTIAPTATGGGASDAQYGRGIFVGGVR